MSLPLALATTTSTSVPGVPAGVKQVRVASSTTTTPVAGLLPKVTVVTPGALSAKPLPVRVTAVPPDPGPAAGLRAVTVGWGMNSTVGCSSSTT